MAAYPAGDVWSQIEFDLSEARDFLHMFLETATMAKGKRIRAARKGKKAEWDDTAPRWTDPNHGVSVRPWLMIPYIHAMDQDELRMRINAGKRLLPAIERRVAARELSPELLHDWGLLNRFAGALRLIYISEPDAGRLREGSQNLNAHKRWFAHYFVRAYKHGRVAETRDLMEHFINSQVKLASSEREWFERFLSDLPSELWPDERRLTRAFREDLSVAKMKRLVKEPPGDIPRLDLESLPP